MSYWPGLLLPHLLPTRHVDGLTGHIAGLVGCEEDHNVADVVVGAAALHRHLVDVFLPDLRLR